MGLIYTPKAGRKPDLQVDNVTGLLTQSPETTATTPITGFGDTTFGKHDSQIWGIPMMWIAEQWLLPVTGAVTTSSAYMFVTNLKVSEWPVRIISIKCFFSSGMDKTDYDGTNGSLLLRIRATVSQMTTGNVGQINLDTAENNKVCVDLPGQEVISPNVLNLEKGARLEIELRGRLEDGSGSTPTLKMITQIMVIRNKPA